MNDGMWRIGAMVVAAIALTWTAAQWRALASDERSGADQYGAQRGTSASPAARVGWTRSARQAAAATQTDTKLLPPGGPIGGTMKALNDIEARIPVAEPFVGPGVGVRFLIDKPGSYYLAEDIFVPAGVDGLRVVAGPVTIDLNGFCIRGEAFSGDAIVAEADEAEVIIRNGFVCKVDGRGVVVGGEAAIIEDLLIGDIGSLGLDLGAERETIVRRVCIDNAGSNAQASERDGVRIHGAGVARLEGVSINAPAGAGIVVQPGATAMVNDASIIRPATQGVFARGRLVMRRSAVESPGGVGIDLGADCILEDSRVAGITGPGILIGDRSRVERNTVRVEPVGEPFNIGIELVGDGGILRDNEVTGGGDSYFGIRLVGSENLIAGNSNAQNGGWIVNNDNFLGPIITNASGFTANRNPFANLDY